MRRGIYETNYGNTAYVSGPKAAKAWDLDQAENIPLSMVVESKFLRAVRPEDVPSPERRRQSMW